MRFERKISKAIVLVAIVAAFGFTLPACGGYHESVVVTEKGKATNPPGQAVASDKHFSQGIKFYERGMYTQALRQFDMSAQKNPNNWESQYYLGLCYRELRDYRIARHRLQLALERSPKDNKLRSRIHAAFGLTWEMAGNEANAHASFQVALTLDESNAEAINGMRRLKGYSEHKKKGARQG